MELPLATKDPTRYEKDGRERGGDTSLTAQEALLLIHYVEVQAFKRVRNVLFRGFDDNNTRMVFTQSPCFK